MKKNLTFLFLATILLTACARKNPATSLDGTTWELVSYGAIENPTPALPDIETSITLDSNGNLGGTVGCNNFSGPYKISKDQLIMGPIMSTEMYCESTMEQEAAVLTLLNGNLTFESNQNTLTLFTEDSTQILHLNKITK